MDEGAVRRITSRLWGPVCAITAAHGGVANGQIAVGVLSASILPEKPRVVVELWKANRTHDLVRDSGAFALHPLTEDEQELTRRLGFVSAHARPDADKLDSLDWHPGDTGSPVLATALGYVECRVVGSLDAGDMTLFLGEVVAGEWHGSDAEPAPAYRMIGAMSQAWQDEYKAHDAEQRAAARAHLGIG